MSNKKIQRIQIPNWIIVDRKFSHHTFTLLLELKMKAYNNFVKIYPTELKDRLSWQDNRKLKRHLMLLYEYKLTDNYVTRVDVYKPIELNLTPIQEGEYFTQVDINTIDKIKRFTKVIEVAGKDKPQDVHEVALRLFYYYEKNYNPDWGYAFPSYEKIRKDTGIDSRYIKAINDVFNNNNIVKVKVGQYYNLVTDNMMTIRREVNKYEPICERYF